MSVCCLDVYSVLQVLWTRAAWQTNSRKFDKFFAIMYLIGAVIILLIFSQSVCNMQILYDTAYIPYGSM